MYCRLLCLSDWLTPSLILQADNKLTSIWFLCSVSWWVCLLWTGTAASLSTGWERAFIIHLLLVPTVASMTPSSILCLQCTNLRCKEACVYSPMETHTYEHKKMYTHTHPRLPQRGNTQHPATPVSLKSHTHCTHTHTYSGIFQFLRLTVVVTNVSLRCLQSG